MSAPEALRAQEFALSRHIRDPEANAPPPAIEERRLQIYRELFYNNVEGLLAGNFPVIRKLLGDAGWHARVRDFFRDYRCSTPLFPELAREFIRFVEQRAAHGGARAASAGCAGAAASDGTGDPPWLPQLAHYEWVELALDIAEDEPTPHDPNGDLLNGVPALSALAWPLAYDWPVHRLAPDFLPEHSDGPSFLLVQRGPDLKVRFHEISALTFRLLQRLEESPTLNGRTQLRGLAEEAQVDDIDSFIEQGRQMLAQLKSSGVLIGTRNE